METDLTHGAMVQICGVPVFFNVCFIPGVPESPKTDLSVEKETCDYTKSCVVNTVREASKVWHTILYLGLFSQHFNVIHSQVQKLHSLNIMKRNV